MVAVAIGMALVFFLVPKHEEENALRAAYHAEDTGDEATVVQPAPAPAAPEAAS